MNFLGIGPTELIAILLLVLIVFKPEDLAQTGRMLGKKWRAFRSSALFATLTGTQTAIRKTAHEYLGGQDLDEIRRELANLNIADSYDKDLVEKLKRPAKDPSEKSETETKE